MNIKSKFFVDVYDCTVYVIVCRNVKRSLDWYAKKNGESFKTYQAEGYIYSPSEHIGEYYMFLECNSLTANTKNHEKSHLVEYILKDRDIKNTGETRAYLDGYISEQIDKILKKRKKAICQLRKLTT